MNIEEFARSVGIELLPWQKDVAKRIEAGTADIMLRPGKSTTFEDIVRDWKRESK